MRKLRTTCASPQVSSSTSNCTRRLLIAVIPSTARNLSPVAFPVFDFGCPVQAEGAHAAGVGPLHLLLTTPLPASGSLEGEPDSLQTVNHRDVGIDLHGLPI